MGSNDHGALKDPGLAAARDAHFERMQAVFDGRDDGRDHAFVLYGEQESAGVEPGEDPMPAIHEGLAKLAERADALRDASVFRPLIFGIDCYGLHFIDRMFGSHGYGAQDQRLRYVHNEVGELPAPNLDEDPGWTAVREATLAYLGLGLTVPLFTPPCLASPLNMATNLYGERFLVGMLQNPDGARRDLRIVTDVIVELNRWYREHVPCQLLQGVAPRVRCQLPGYGHIDGCSTHLLGPGQYRDFIAPLDEEVLSVHPKGGMIHLCGHHTQHIPTWREMPSLKCVQLSSVANEELESHVEGLRDDQVIYVGPTEALPLERIMNATGGWRVILAEDLPEPLPERRPHHPRAA